MTRHISCTQLTLNLVSLTSLFLECTSEANMGACPGAKTKKNNYSISEDNFSST